MQYYVKGTCWSEKKHFESHQEENCVDMTYAIYDSNYQVVSFLFSNRNEAERALIQISD